MKRVLASMRGRLTLVFAVSIALFLTLLCASVISYSSQLEATQLAQSLEAHAEKYRSALHDERKQPRTAEEWQRFLNRENHTFRDYPLSMMVLDRAQNVVARTHGNGPAWPLNGDWLVETIETRNHVLVLAVRWHSTQRELRGLSYKLSLVSMGVILATAIGSWLLVGRVLSPIDLLSHQANSASSEDLRVRLQSPSRDVEVLRLVATLNAFLDRLAHTSESRGRFYAAASHELRTPIQGLSALLEVGLSRPRDSQQWEEIASEALGESRRLGALTQDLLTLNQLENQTIASACSEVEAADVVERIVNQLRGQIEAKKLTFIVDLPEDAEVYAPWNHVEMLFRNLIENSVKYCTEGGDVRILLRRSEGVMRLSVWNSAVLPAHFEADKLFEPFYRLDAARQSTTGGNGLGLSLVSSLCRANGWNAQLKSENHGLLALIEIPDSASVRTS